VDWDLDMGGEEPLWYQALLWNGAALGFAWMDDVPAPVGSALRVLLQARDSHGYALSPPLVVCTEETESDCGNAFAAAYPDGWGVVHSAYEDGAHFLTVTGDGSSFSDHVPLARDPIHAGSTEPQCIAWTGSDFAVLLMKHIMGTDPVYSVAWVSPDGVVDATVALPIPDPGNFGNVQQCLWTPAGLNVLVEHGSGEVGLELFTFGRDGAILVDRALLPRLMSFGDARLVWTASEFGFAWSDDRTGHLQLYFVRMAADGAFLSGEAPLMRGRESSRYLSLDYSGEAYGVAWNGDDGTVAGAYFAAFTVCP
jgi:hypothetical protein